MNPKSKSTPKKVKRYLLTLAADETDKSKGLKVLLKSLNKNYPLCFEEWNVYVLTPKQFRNKQIRDLEPKASYLLLDSEYFETIYFYKMILIKFIKDYCQRDDEILYLDYDHICTAKFELPQLDRNTIYVSSEIHRIDSSLSTSILKSGIGYNCREHFNTSLIYSTAETFLKATFKWKQFGRLFEQKIRLRNAEEITFTLSAQFSNVRIIPVSDQIQSNWTNLSMAPLFHYGGETVFGKAFKSFINEYNSRSKRATLIAPSNSLVEYYFNLLQSLLDT